MRADLSILSDIAQKGETENISKKKQSRVDKETRAEICSYRISTLGGHKPRRVTDCLKKASNWKSVGLDVQLLA